MQGVTGSIPVSPTIFEEEWQIFLKNDEFLMAASLGVVYFYLWRI